MMSNAELLRVISLLESYARKMDYKGYCKFDALNSPVVEKLCGNSMIARLVASQIVNRIPLNLRLWTGVRAFRNPKGVSNFIRGYCSLYRATHDPIYLSHARELGDWLLQNDSKSKGAYAGTGISWGYQFPWQSPGFFAPRNYPNCIVSTFCGAAMLELFKNTGNKKYLDAALGVKEFLLKDLPVLEQTEDRKCIGYVANGPRWKVININSVVAGFLIKVAHEIGDQELARDCQKMINWVMSVREADDSWNYTIPKSDSGIGPDNYHTGGILDGVFDYMTITNDYVYLPVYTKALDFYKNKLFTEDFAPKWRSTKNYPMDVHGSAQGILTFVRAGSILNKEENLMIAGQITEWAIKNLWDECEGRFYYQKRRLFTWKIDLMRWNNSWMFWALADYYLYHKRAELGAA